MSINRIKEKIKKYDYISFDLYDTLIARNVQSPEEVFDLVEDEYVKRFNSKAIMFKNKRLEAYKKAYSEKGSKCVIEDIYDKLDYDDATKERLKELEIEIEIKIATPRKEYISLYNYAVSMKKKVVITTDMYLPISVIEELLNKCEISKYAFVFLSCEYGVSKTDGGLYDIVMKELNCSAGQLLHIGDGWKNDVLRARLKGIATERAVKANRLSYYSEKGFSEIEKRIYRQQQALINNNIADCSSRAEALGFEVFGPLLYGFTEWLYRSLKEKGISKVFFLSREGMIFRDVFSHMYPDSGFEIHYLYVSRKSIIPSTYWIHPEYEVIMNSMSKSKQVTVMSQIEKWGLNSDECNNEIERVGFEKYTIIDGREWNSDKRIRALFDLLKNQIIKESKEQFNIVKSYLEQEGFGGDCAIVDIGWNGGMQNAFQKVAQIWDTPTRVYGYYMGINPRNLGSKLFEAHGYIYDEEHGDTDRYYIYSFAGPLELTMMAPHNSTVGYAKEEEKIVPVLEENGYIRVDGSLSVEMEYTLAAQKGIKDYIKMAMNSYFGEHTSYNTSFRNCRLFGLSPRKTDIKLFQDFQSVDMGQKQIFVRSSEKAFSLKGVVHDFWFSTWKSGYMKQLFLLPLPYYKIYLMVRKRIN